MTIRKQLFISNILMVVLPVLLVIIANVVVYTIYSGITGIRPGNGAPSDTPLHPDALNDGFILFVTFYFVVVVLIVLAVNLILTGFIFKGIVSPLETLSAGVRQIRDGNLSYRIEYDGRDEFSAVCDDFNEMGARLLEMVEQKQRDEKSRQELIAGISHDLRTPLTSIKAYLEGLEKGVAKTPEAEQKYFDVIKSKTENLEYIINQLFVFSKLDTGEFPLNRERLDIVDELRNLTNEIADEHREENIDISFTSEDASMFCEIDAVQFENVIKNVIANSMKYKQASNVRSEVTCARRGNRAVIEIADDGPGVSSAALPRLFEIFYREDESRKGSDDGSGIGLAISRKIIEQFEGTMYARNREGGGLIITIDLPLDERGTYV